MDYSKYFSRNAALRNTSWIGMMKNLRSVPGMLWLASGLPNCSSFPFSEATFKLTDGNTINISSEKMNDALQYGSSVSYPPLLEYLSDLTQRIHAPPRWSEIEQVVTVGGQDGMAKAFVMLTDPGDYIIIPDPCYAGIFSELQSLDPRYIGVVEDEEGMRPDVLRTSLAKWTAETGGLEAGKKIKFLYTNPSASNPSGTTLSEPRRRQIYAIACEYDFLILEDDPYYFLQFSENISPSFLSLDTDCRVLRFDSFSKTVSAGLRVGFVTGPAPLVHKISQHVMATVFGTSSLSQVLVAELFRVWGIDGFLKHVNEVRDFYRARRNVMLRSAEKHLLGLCEWNVPQGGMFLWIKVLGVKDTQKLILERGIARKVALVPGKGFTASLDHQSQYIRATYSTLSPEMIDKAFKILSEVIKEEIQVGKQ